MKKGLKEKIADLIIENLGVSNKKLPDQILELFAQEKEKLLTLTLERIKLEKKVESDFLDWHSEMTITTESRKDARLWRDIYNQAVADLEKLKEALKKEL